MPNHIAVDLGGTHCRVAAYASYEDVEPIACETFRVQKVGEDLSEQEMREPFMEDFRRLCATIRSVTDEPRTISLAVAGKVNSRRTALLGAGNLVHWVGRVVQRMLREHFACPMTLGNDAEAAALAEALQGYGQGCDFLSVIWGSGVGGCGLYWLDDQPYALPTELGHQSIGGNSGVTCGCGQSNCLEAWCGGDNIAKFHRHIESMDPRDWEVYADKMARGIYNSLVHHPVPLVVFTGGVACKQQWMLPLIGRQLQSRLTIVEAPRVVLSKFGESAGTHGALALGRRLLNGDAVAA